MKHRPSPPFDIVGPCSRRLTVTTHTSADTVGDLAAALGLPRAAGLSIDGRHVAHHEPLVASGARAGSVVGSAAMPALGTIAASVPDVEPELFAGVELVVVAGPACGLPRPLRPGRHVIGRSSSADVRIDDPSMELHHGVVDIGLEGHVMFRQLTGRRPATIGTVPCAGDMPVPPGAVLSIGASEVLLRRRGDSSFDPPAGRLGPIPNDPWRRIVQRGPDAPLPRPTIPVRPPEAGAHEPMPPATALIGAGVAVAGAAFVAVLLGQMMFALFAGIGAVASLATWAVGVGGVVRRRRAGRRHDRDEERRFADELDAAQRAARVAHLVANPAVEQALRSVAALSGEAAATDVWRRRHRADGPPLRVVLGRGVQRWTPRLDGDASALAPTGDLEGELADVAVAWDLPADAAFAVRGDPDVVHSVVRSVLVQLATHYGPADVQLIVVSRLPELWRWVGWLPHARTVAGDVALIDATDAAALGARLDVDVVRPHRPVVLIVDEPELFATRTGPLRRFVDVVAPCTIALAPSGASVPALCGDVLDVGAAGTLKWSGGHAGSCGPFRPAGITLATAGSAARELAGLVDPEDAGDIAATTPSTVTLADLDDVIGSSGSSGRDLGDRRRAGARSPVGHRVGAAAIAQRWATAGDDPAPVAALGMSADGLVEVDLVRDGPHALIAGTTGAGKSELLRTLVIGLALRQSPDDLCFVLVDYKGGSTFDACNDLVHTVGTVTDLDDGLAERALISLDAELHRRERILRSAGAADLTEYRLQPGRAPLPRLVVVIDEFAALAKELPEFLAALVGVAQRGRSLGLHLMLATQRPAGVVSDDIRANTNLRIALRLNATADASDVVGDDTPATFPRGVPGRASLRLGPDELVVFQTASCTADVEATPGRLRVASAERDEVAIAERDEVAIAEADEVAAAEAHEIAVGAIREPTSQLAAAVAVITDAARLAGTATPHRPWIDALPDVLTMAAIGHVAPDGATAAAGVPDGGVDGRIAGGVVGGVGGRIPGGVVGLADDPAAQCRRPLRWDGERGNLALLGALGTGRTSTLVALLATRCRTSAPDRLHCYVIDAHGDASFDPIAKLAHCGGVIGVADIERVHRLLSRLVASIEERAAGCGTDVEMLLAIDGLRSLRTALTTAERAPTLDLLDRVLADGPALRILTCWSDVETAAGVVVHAGDTWTFGAQGARSVVPGRLRVASSGLVAQVAQDAGALDGVSRVAVAGGPAPVARLPQRIRATAVVAPPDDAPNDAPADVPVAAPLELPVGVADDSLAVATLRVPPEDHVFIGGAALTGKTTMLLQVSHAWRRLVPTGVQLFVGRRDPLTQARLEAASDAPVLVVVDDADRVDDVAGVLAAIVAGEFPGVTIAAAARVDAVRASYGHWTRDVARSRCGMILTSAGEVDGDLLGVMLPRHPLIPPRPGLGWLVDDRGHRLVQVAQADVEFVGQPDDGGVSPSSHRGPVPCCTAVSSGL